MELFTRGSKNESGVSKESRKVAKEVVVVSYYEHSGAVGIEKRVQVSERSYYHYTLRILDYFLMDNSFKNSIFVV